MVVIHAGSKTHVVFTVGTARTFEENFPVFLSPNGYYEIAVYQVLVDFEVIGYTIFVIVQVLSQNICRVLDVFQGCFWGRDYVDVEDIHKFVEHGIEAIDLWV